MSELNGGRDPAWWLKGICLTLFGLLSAVLLKGCDEWQKSTAASNQLIADMKYLIQRDEQREKRVDENEKNLQLLYEKTVERFEQRREIADKVIKDVYERLYRMERTP